MPDLNRKFYAGKMNKDLDERLVPNGEYRDAMNVQVSTSDDSDVGSIQNLLGNIDVSSNFFIDQQGEVLDSATLETYGFYCVGSITDVVVSGASTFTGVGTFLSDLYVGGSAYITGDLTFDEFTARNASITGIATAANFHIGAGGTVLNASNTGTFAIGSGTTLATVTINGGSVPSIGLVIALGG